MLKISAISKWNSKYVCFSNEIKSLFELDESGNIHLLYNFKDENTDRITEKLIIWNNKVIIVPLSAKNIYIYDLVFGTIDSIPLSTDRMDIKFKFFNGYIHGNDLFLIGAFYPAILKVNLIDYSLMDINVYRDLELRQLECGDCYARKSIYQKNNKLLIASALSNRIYIFDMDTLEYKVEKVGKEEQCYSGIEYDGVYYWLLPRFGTTLSIVDFKGYYEEIDLSNYCEPGYNFAGIMLDKQEMWLYSLNLEYSLTIHISTKKIKKHYTGKDVLFERVDGEIINQFNDGEIITKKCGIKIKNNKVVQLLFYRQKDEIFRENSDCSLYDFVSMGFEEGRNEYV